MEPVPNFGREVLGLLTSPGPFAKKGRFASLVIANKEGTVKLEGHIGLTIHVSEPSQIERSHGGRTRLIPTRVASTFVDVPGSDVTVAVRRRVAVVQAAIPLDRIQLMASEDHQWRLDIGQFGSYRLFQDLDLLRLALTSMQQPRFQSLVEHELVRRLIVLTNGKVVDWRGGLPPVLLHRLEALVDERLHDITLTEMASVVALSPHHFSREFKRTTGTTPWAYVTDKRLARAVDLLRLTNLAGSEIARLTGFNHASHLSRRMQARLRIAPSDLRRVLR